MRLRSRFVSYHAVWCAQVGGVFPSGDRSGVGRWKQPTALEETAATPFEEAELIGPRGADRDSGIFAAQEARPTAREQREDKQAHRGGCHQSSHLLPTRASSQQQVTRHRDEVRQEERKRIGLGKVRERPQQAADSTLPERARVVGPDHDTQVDHEDHCHEQVRCRIGQGIHRNRRHNAERRPRANRLGKLHSLSEPPDGSQCGHADRDHQALGGDLRRCSQAEQRREEPGKQRTPVAVDRLRKIPRPILSRDRQIGDGVGRNPVQMPRE